MATADTYLIFDIYLIFLTLGLLTWGSRKQPLDETESIKWSTTEPPHYMSYHTYKLSQSTKTWTKQTMIAAEEAVLTEALALLPPVLIFRRIPKCFDTAVWHFLSSSPEQKITYLLTNSIAPLYLLFRWTKTNFG